MLALYKRDKRPDIELIPMTAIVVARPFQWMYANMSCRKITELTGVEFGEHHFHATAPILYQQDIVPQSPADHVYVAECKFIDSLYDNNIIDAHFAGITLNPPISAFPDMKGRGSRRDVLPNNQKYLTCVKDERGNYSYRPFVNIDKKGICELYNNLGVLDELFPLTHSCENYNEHTMMQLDLSKHCGLSCCWWCQERLWGFGKLDALTKEQIIPSPD
jgi:hypothetical protein